MSTICVMSETDSTDVTIYANSCRLNLSIADAFQLQAHLSYLLQQIVEDQVVRERRNMISGAYRD